ncbi:MAG: hypothetical protein AAB434_09215 [Planctomycetota bacterium]
MTEPTPPARNASPTDYLPKERRTIYVVDRDFQFRYLTNWIFMTLGFIAVIIAVLYAGLTLLHKVEPERAFSTLSFMLKANGLFVVLLTLFMGLYTILLSHRVAGPAYRISRCVQRMCEGAYDFTVTLRKKDYLKDVATDMNVLLADLRKRQAKVRDGLEAARIAKAKSAQGGGSADLVADLDRACAALEEALRKAEAPADKGPSPPPAAH